MSLIYKKLSLDEYRKFEDYVHANDYIAYYKDKKILITSFETTWRNNEILLLIINYSEIWEED